MLGVDEPDSIRPNAGSGRPHPPSQLLDRFSAPGRPIQPPVDHEYLLVQSELYLGPDGQPGDLTKMQGERHDAVVFNGYVNQYKDRPIRVEPNQRVRVWVLDAGPNENSARVVSIWCSSSAKRSTSVDIGRCCGRCFGRYFGRCVGHALMLSPGARAAPGANVPAGGDFRPIGVPIGG